MTTNQTPTQITAGEKRPAKGRATVIGLLILAAAIGAAVWMVRTKPKAKPAEFKAEIPLVEAAYPVSTNAQVLLEAMGVVIAKDVVTLQAEVSGVVTGIHPELVAGGLVRRGDVLIQLDDRNYRYALQQKQAALDTAKSNLRMEMGQQDIALVEWKLIAGEGESPELDRELALREPQRLAKEADVTAAQAARDRAELDMERTAITVPFNAVVTAAGASVGDQANAGSILAQLVETDVFRIKVAVRLDSLRWILFPDATAGQPGSEVIIYTGEGGVRHGRVFKRLAELDPTSHMAQLLVTVEDPLNLAGSPETPPLLLNQYVRVELIGRLAEDVCRIPRSALHDGATLWMLDENSRLQMRPAQIRWSARDEVYLGNTFDSGWRIVLSNLGAPVEGMELAVEGESP